MIGSRLAHYEIVAPLGRGGMGEVFRARDTKLDREVAIKLLPRELRDDPERVARFGREARTLAALHHPNIASLFGLEQDGEHRYLVMECVDGEDLGRVLRQGPLDLEETLDVARQLAEGLEEAHEKGIVHRDLKPANIMRTPDGRVKVLDFGLARAVLGEGVDEGDPSQSPTITAAMTIAGTVLGTAAYMSPEQARGKTVDRRADLWAFGCILWEMLTGRRLFEGETVSDTLAAVLRADPPWDDLPNDTPPAVIRLLERCLERDPRRRLRDIGEARIRLERWRDDPTTLHASASIPVAVDSDRKSWIPWTVAVLGVLLAVGSWLVRPSAQPPEAPKLEVALQLDGLDPMTPNIGPSIQISPDGQWLSYFASTQIHLQHLSTRRTRALGDLAYASSMAFSPDSRWLAFQSDGRIWRAAVEGGAPIEVCTVDDPRGIAWVDDQTLVFNENFATALTLVDLRTGEKSPLTTLDASKNERSHRWPSTLPDQHHVLFMSQELGQSYAEATIRVVDTRTGESRDLLRGGSFPRYAVGGLLTFVRDRTLIGIEFDPETMEVSGLPKPLLENLATLVADQETDDGSAEISWSDDGTMVYRTDAAVEATARPSWLDLNTGELTEIAAPGEYVQPCIAPDGRSFAVSRVDGSTSRIMLIDLETGTSRALTDGTGRAFVGGFDPTGKTFYWNRWADTTYLTLRQSIDSSAPPETLAAQSTAVAINVVSRDGTKGLFIDYGTAGAWDTYKMDLTDPDPTLIPFDTSPGIQVGQAMSPDGQWVAYGTSEGGGQSTLLLASYSDPSRSWVLHESTGAPTHLMWHPSGDRVFLRDRATRTIVEVPLDFRSGVPVPGVRRTIAPDPYIYVREFHTMAIALDGERLLVFNPEAAQAENVAHGRTILATHWFARLEADEE